MPQPDIDAACALITALFIDYLTIDITETEWAKLQKRLEYMLLKIKSEPPNAGKAP
jgi:hypothetical protein